MTSTQRQISAKWWRWFLILWLLCLPLFAGLSALVKLAAYEMGGAPSVREMVGQRVAFRADDFSGRATGAKVIRGTLVDAHYRFNDKWGFFDLRVYVQGDGAIGEGGSISTGLGPSDLARITKDEAPSGPP